MTTDFLTGCMLGALVTIVVLAPVWYAPRDTKARTLHCIYLGVQHIDGVANGWHVSQCDDGLIVFSKPTR